MRPIMQLAYLAGPGVLRDLVAGTGGIVVAAAAVLAGCAFFGPSPLTWFAFLGVSGGVSLCTAWPGLRTAVRLARPVTVAEPGGDAWRAAA